MSWKEIDFMHTIDWTSVKLSGASICFTAITWSNITAIGSGLVILSTLIYNGIRIYKELKK